MSNPNPYPYQVVTHYRPIPNNANLNTEDEKHKMIKIGADQGVDAQFNPDMDLKKNKQVLQKEYDTRCIKYANEDYSYLSNVVLSRFAQNESSSQVSTAYPLFKMLRGIARKFMLNELEIIFFLHQIEEQKWRFEDPIIAEFAPHFQTEFLSTHEVSNTEQYKKLLIFLVCWAYTIKCYFNDQSDQELLLITQHIQSYSNKDFKKFIEQYRQKYMDGKFKIVPRQINKMYNKLIKVPRDSQNILQQDYNALVDSIIQISPPYSNQEHNKSKDQQQQSQGKQQSQQQQAQQPQVSQYSVRPMQQSQNMPFYQSHDFQQYSLFPPDLSKLNSVNFQDGQEYKLDNDQQQYQILQNKLFLYPESFNQPQQPPLLRQSSQFNEKQTHS